MLLRTRRLRRLGGQCGWIYRTGLGKNSFLWLLNRSKRGHSCGNKHGGACLRTSYRRFLPRHAFSSLEGGRQNSHAQPRRATNAKGEAGRSRAEPGRVKVGTGPYSAHCALYRICWTPQWSLHVLVATADLSLTVNAPRNICLRSCLPQLHRLESSAPQT